MSPAYGVQQVGEVAERGPSAEHVAELAALTAKLKALQAAALEHETKPCPECAQGKHGNCDGSAWCRSHDALELCPCAESDHQ